MSGVVDRRTTLRWIVAAGAVMQLPALQAGEIAKPAAPSAASGYGTDPDLSKSYVPGELWPLTMTREQREIAAVLCDLIIPRDARSPGAADLRVHVFIDEWISAPYPRHVQDRKLILAGFAWLDGEARRRVGAVFRALPPTRQRAICDDICYLPKAKPAFAEAARFFARYRDLTAGGYYTTRQGWADIGYVGNVSLPKFDGPPIEALRKVGLA